MVREEVEPSSSRTAVAVPTWVMLRVLLNVGDDMVTVAWFSWRLL